MSSDVLIKTYAWLTPAAPAAIAIVQCTVSADVIDRRLPNLGKARFALLVDMDAQPVDEVVVVRTSEDLMELQCHGGVGIRAAIEQALAAHGYQQSEPLLDEQWQAFARLAHRAAIAPLSAHLQQDKPVSAAQPLWFKQPVVLLTGPSNAGKSTLLNAWCGHARAIVSDRPGTTRDLLAAVTEVHDWQLQLLDSAGLRAGADDLEMAGQALVAQARTWVDLVVYLDPDGTAESRSAGGAEPGDLIVRSKWDLAAGAEASDAETSTRGLVWSAPEFAGTESAAIQLQLIGEAVLERLDLAWTLPSADD